MSDINDYIKFKVDNKILNYIHGIGVPEEISEEFYDLWIREFKRKDYYEEELFFPKDSDIGKWLVEEQENKNDKMITFEKVRNAMEVAIYQDDAKMTNKIIPMFQKRIEGTREELMSERNREVLDYIIENSSFEDFLEKESLDDKECLVCEDGKIIKKVFEKGKKKVKRRD